jgi:hypothetical protein
VVECDTCQGNKGETAKALGTLKMIPLPPTIWMNISMYFIVGLPKLVNKSFIMVVIDRISKFALQHPFTASTVAQVFMDNIFKQHDTPHSIVYDHDPNFSINLWNELFKL